MKRLKGLIPCCILELKNSETTGIFYPHWDRFFEVVLQNKNKMRARACSSVLQWFRQRHLPNRTRRFPIPNAMLPFGWLCVQTQSFLWRTGQLGSPVLHKTADLFDCTFLVDQLVTCILQAIAGEQPGWKSDSITPLSSPRKVHSTSSYTSAQLTANTELLTPNILCLCIMQLQTLGGFKAFAGDAIWPQINFHLTQFHVKFWEMQLLISSHCQ